MITIDKGSSKPYYEQLILSVKEAILQGILRPGDKLPSVRELAKELLMNPNTVAKAYKVLEMEQTLVTIKGKGTFVKAASDLPRDEVRVGQLKQKLEELVVEAAHLQISEAELINWLQQNYRQMGGNRT
ncbi:GntR family transcriptional regulator [Enterococcus diestrammenae]|uniref:GntR family transcriptional regulator n=1 Tax=Enterococcus diestrammenae TaxID=1155073 RepID=A0ABV0F3L8_9ENTE|nr:GntR family transcriptional regulator [Enterococcus diestrammenae]KAF1297745.1 GntR family transcriptional regulator [Enterococcus diestrammenae]HIX69171.1 GntR family transcriptional regulator [Candidatus Enterococcus stercoravium]